MCKLMSALVTAFLTCSMPCSVDKLSLPLMLLVLLLMGHRMVVLYCISSRGDHPGKTPGSAPLHTPAPRGIEHCMPG